MTKMSVIRVSLTDGKIALRSKKRVDLEETLLDCHGRCATGALHNQNPMML